MKNRPLMDVMNEMASRPEAVLAHSRRAEKQARPRDLKREVAAFIMVDPLLADLHKRHLDAKNDFRRLVRLNGPRDPMSEVAADMSDSTRSAFDTRLIEVQRDKEIRRLAFRKMKEIEQEEFDAQVKASNKYRNDLERFYNNQIDRERAVKLERDSRSHFQHLSFMFWLLQFYMIEAETRLSLMQDFATANQERKRRKSGAASW